MPKRSIAENLDFKSQKKTKLTLQDIEENSIDQLFAQPIPAFQKTLEKLLAANNEEITRLTNLNEKILKCLDRIDQDSQQANIEAAVGADEIVQEQKLSRTPTCWSELPEKVWLKVFQNMKLTDVNTVHLVCHKLHQIVNLRVNPKLSFDYRPTTRDLSRNLESLAQSSRVFEELEFMWGKKDHCFECPEKFEIFQDYLSFAGIYIKTIAIRFLGVHPMVLQKLLSLLPNLESLELWEIWTGSEEEQAIKWDVKSRKIQRVKMYDCLKFVGLLESLEKCAIKEAELECCSSHNNSTQVVHKFLKSQEKSLKKLTIGFFINLPVDLKGLQLEYLDVDTNNGPVVSLEFLRDQVDLKFLKLSIDISAAIFDMIWKLKNLETLELGRTASDANGLNNLHKLKKLKSLKVGRDVSRNVLEHLRFGVLNDLDELDAYFDDASLESVQEMKRITPKLKKIVLRSGTSDTMNALLETLEKLESVKIQQGPGTLNKKVYPNIKYFSVSTEFKFSAAQFSKMFPNIECLKLFRCVTEITEPFLVTLLSGLKQLKTLQMNIQNYSGLDRESALQFFQQYGSSLEEASVSFRISDSETVPGFSIKKRPGDSFCITKFDFITDYS